MLNQHHLREFWGSLEGGQEMKAGMLYREGDVLVLSDGIREYKFSLENLTDFISVARSDLNANTSVSQRCFGIKHTNIHGYFNKPNEEGIVKIEFHNGRALWSDTEVNISLRDLYTLLTF